LLPDVTLEFYTTLKRLKTEVKNVPEVYIRGQGGLAILIMLKWLDLHHLCFTEGGGEGGNTKLMSQPENESLVQIESLYKCEGNTTKGQHFGSRIVFDNEGL
jgi:hypothetical protein